MPSIRHSFRGGNIDCRSSSLVSIWGSEAGKVRMGWDGVGWKGAAVGVCCACKVEAEGLVKCWVKRSFAGVGG